MARKSKKETAAEEKKAPAKEAPKYGVNELAESVGIAPASVRVSLRALGVEKNHGNQYGWSNQKDFNEVVKAMKERSAKSAVAGKADEKPASKPKTSRKPRAKK